ncbi:3-carboxyethylcatechol 2,3-dioxygenase [Micromonospora inositola]|uniref:2,3-dihydroxyphenylpropionate/2,3-dihydroxicinnamic acid 1,2-dioxygenase n=1 Tax=Micromonospora inositola TaxID=47865 RepID=A0A1C5K5F3_9ACTN|nr:3-carboxyethylcatechol 2,3-dioxygenase [Micromonospora inositola]SCG78000.1 2,3-dihydroxyphenylpropionate 1,2-dioxygenase [Micromonospora inositola]
MPVALVCMSHSPLLRFAEPPAEVRAAVDDAFGRVREFVADYDPTLVVSFAPDHYNGFFYELMPPFCVGYEAESVGDYGTQLATLDVATDVAERLAAHVMGHDIDMAISRRMRVDHGAVQPLEVLFGGITAKRVVPVFVNGVARPFTSMRRIGQMGAAVGDFVRGLDERVLVIGSGGLSHDPPVPQWATANPAQREMLLSLTEPTNEARRAREQRVIDAAKRFAAGEADIMDLNPSWDEAFMDLLASGQLEKIDGYQPAEMAAEAGNSAHEVRTWVAAFNALAASGPYEVIDRFYRPIPEFIAGFGVMTARVAGVETCPR